MKAARRMWSTAMASSKRWQILRAAFWVAAGLAGGCAVQPAHSPESAAAPTVAQAIETGRCAELDAILATGAEAKPPDAKLTPLALAVARRQPLCAQTLLANGADPDLGLADGSSPLLLAAGDGNEALVAILIAGKASPGRANRSGVTPLAAAAGSGHQAVVSRLLAAGAPVDSQSARGWTALFHAIAEGRLLIVDQLLQAGASGAHRDVNGTVPLMIAAAACAECIAPLLAHGAELDAVDVQGITALMVAAQNGQQRAVGALLAAGADATRRDRNGRDWRDWGAAGH
jgi:ankyrin repeat protein